ncbi:MAG: hypothetical protein E7001_04935 [Coriobacteriaceae bacterium]|nr:hypothetical protein [Coriobacteriaceae bacterium]
MLCPEPPSGTPPPRPAPQLPSAPPRLGATPNPMPPSAHTKAPATATPSRGPQTCGRREADRSV